MTFSSLGTILSTQNFQEASDSQASTSFFTNSVSISPSVSVYLQTKESIHSFRRIQSNMNRTDIILQNSNLISKNFTCTRREQRSALLLFYTTIFFSIILQELQTDQRQLLDEQKYHNRFVRDLYLLFPFHTIGYTPITTRSLPFSVNRVNSDCNSKNHKYISDKFQAIKTYKMFFFFYLFPD